METGDKCQPDGPLGSRADFTLHICEQKENYQKINAILVASNIDEKSEYRSHLIKGCVIFFLAN